MQVDYPRDFELGPLRFAARLLFQHWAGTTLPGPRRLVQCEERMVVFPGVYGRAAIAKAKSYAESKEFVYLEEDGREVHFEFVGIIDAVMLDPYCCDVETVWYDVCRLRSPMTRKHILLRNEDRLLLDLERQWSPQDPTIEYKG